MCRYHDEHPPVSHNFQRPGGGQDYCCRLPRHERLALGIGLRRFFHPFQLHPSRVAVGQQQRHFRGRVGGQCLSLRGRTPPPGRGLSACRPLSGILLERPAHRPAAFGDEQHVPIAANALG